MSRISSPKQHKISETKISGKNRKTTKTPTTASTGAFKKFSTTGVLDENTPAKRVLRLKIISEKDNEIASAKVRPSNIRYHLLMIICMLLIVCGIGIEVWYLISVNKTANEFSEIAEAYTVDTVQNAPYDFDSSLYPPVVDFEGLKTENPDISAWLRIPDTTVDYPVLTSSTQDEYLNLDMYGNYSISGSIFADFENSSDLDSDSHIIIYGHHMIAPIMFHDVSYYSDYDFFMSHRTIYFETPNTTYTLIPVGSYIANSWEYMVRQTSFGNEQDFQSYLDERLECCDIVYELDVERRTMDKLFTLVTCTADGSARVVVECVVAQTYPTSKIPYVLTQEAARGQAEANANANN